MKVVYEPPGRVAAEFHEDKSFVKGLLGPVGSGKSTTCVMDLMAGALEQTPYMGVRHTRNVIIRNTYPELKSTTIKTWLQQIPEQVAPIRWDPPITQHVKIRDIGDGTGIDMENIFLAIDRPEDLGKLRSLEATRIWINEASELPKAVLDMATQRVGRYPSKIRGGPSHTGVLMDTNPPDDDHWWYGLAEEQTNDGFKFHRQPGGLMWDPELKLFVPNPDAENVHNLPDGYVYYLRQVAGKSDAWIRVFLCAEYGRTLDGKPVYPEFRDDIHTAKERLEPMAGLPLILGWDFGLTPSCIVGQLSPRGQLVILHEYVAEDMGIRQFAEEIVKPGLYNEFQLSRRRYDSVCDPAGVQRSQVDEITPLDELIRLGIYTEPAATNNWEPRREAVAYFLNRMIDGGPGFAMDRDCRTLRKGFNGGYSYGRVLASGSETRYQDRPKKNRFSHPHDALQYLCMRARGAGGQVRARAIVQSNKSGWT